ncbi:MAG TPA: alpha/beta hydrolase-fold protein [Myxococcaceae bacterium]|jgi:predicted alpha/beta superfamily hydrolase
MAFVTHLLLALTLAGSGAMTETAPLRTVTLVVTGMPQDTPADARVTLAGGVNGWNPEAPGFAFTPGEGGTQTLQLKLREGQAFEYRLTRGRWDTAERNADGSERRARTLVVRGDMRVELRVERWLDSPGKVTLVKSTLTGNIEHLRDVKSPQLGNSRNLLVYLPPSYKKGTKRYPVLYMHDGQNVFNELTAYVKREWRADEAAEALAARGHEVILVAIENAGGARAAEYLPFKTRHNHHEPRAEAHAAFVVKTVKPMIDERYRTLPDAAHTGIAGSSFGGVISLYTGLSYPEVFGFVGAFSPSLWVGDGSLFHWVKEHPAPKTMRLWLDMGDHEGDMPGERLYAMELTEGMGDLLREQGAQVRVQFGKDAWHNEDAWAQRFPTALEWFVTGK